MLIPGQRASERSGRSSSPACVRSIVSLTSVPIETIRLRAARGSGTIESPWLDWEAHVEEALHGAPRTFLFGAGFWGVSRSIRLGSAVKLAPEHPGEGRPWFVPSAELDSMFVVDGTHEVSLRDLGLEGRGGRARHGVLVRCGTRVEVRGCRFDDFGARGGCALRIAGESSDRWVRGVVVEGCTFLNGTVGMSVERDARDLLVADNRFEDIAGAALRVDPRGEWVDYGMLVLKNRIRAGGAERADPLVRIASGAQNLRFAENVLEGPDGDGAVAAEAPAGIELQGVGSAERLRLEVLSNRFASLGGPAIEARQCGPGLVASGNEITDCGTSHRAAIELSGCRGAAVEDNEVSAPRGAGVRLTECRRVRAQGNEVRGGGRGDDAGGAGFVVEGAGSHRIRLADNRASGLPGAGIDVWGGSALRLVGNEVQECREGIRVRAGKAVVLVGNDCRANGTGIRVDDVVVRAVLALNQTIRNVRLDLEIRGERVRTRDNRTGRGQDPPPIPA